MLAKSMPIGLGGRSYSGLVPHIPYLVALRWVHWAGVAAAAAGGLLLGFCFSLSERAPPMQAGIGH